jgi:two-component system, chemotaxis family, CheB/CheR fusion protein
VSDTERGGTAGKGEAQPRASFPIVGVGASAGGLAPTVDLLRCLGSAPGVALVVVHHLDPTHESGLVDILSRVTEMPVVVARDGVRVEPDHVYVIPPNSELLISQGFLELVPRIAGDVLHLPIDRFFEALALDRTALAIGVVLSGSGFDGTEGVKALKREGGVALAQDTTAQYASMPQSAIATGCVDFILPPAGIAREIARLAHHMPSELVIPAREPEEPQYRKILALVRKATGIDFASYKRSTIRRRMQRRVLVRGVKDLDEYAELLQSDPSEVNALSEDVLIHVTGFFREPAVFEALRTTVFPKLLDERPHDLPIRVWVPGCSTGEEVYSIAISLLEYLEDTQKIDIAIKIFGTDLSLATVEMARAGRYAQSIERDVSQGRLQRFFTKDLGTYQIRRDVRDLCVFAKHDVTRDPPFSSMDLVSCRNLMIYLGAGLQDRVVAVFHYALKEPGFLVLGSSETVRAFTGFTAVDGKNKIYARTSAAPRMVFDFAAPHSPPELTTGAARAAIERPGGARSSSPPDVYREADRLVLAAYAPPGVVVTDDLAIVQFRGQTGVFLEPAPGLASLDLLRMAREEFRLPLRRAVEKARADRVIVRETGIVVTVGDQLRTIALEVIPFAVHATQQRFFLVLFDDVTPSEAPIASAPPLAPDAQRDAVESQLRQELSSTRQYLESVIEQLEASNEELKAANEEIVSSNEELRSTNEELQSAKEELQATNEELLTLNHEMTDRNVEATRLNDDLSNVLSSVELPIILLGRDSRIRKVTPAAERAFELEASAVGRPIAEVKSLAMLAPTLPAMIQRVIERLRSEECVGRDASGRWYQVAVRPYVTAGGRIDGTVVTALDVDAAKKASELATEARQYADSIVNAVGNGLVVLDGDDRVRSTNKAFQQMFQVFPGAVEGRRLDELGYESLGAPRLTKLVEGVRKGSAFDGFRLEHQSPAAGSRVFLVNGRMVEDTPRVLLAFQDVTEMKRAAEAVKRAELGFRDVMLHAAEAIIMVDAAGLIVFANHAAAALFGYGPDELQGMSVDALLPQGLRDGHAQLRADYMRTAEPRPMGRDRELNGLRKDGTTVPIEVILSVVSPVGEPLVVAFVTDITLRRASEKAIRAYQEKLQNMAFDAARTEERERRRIAVELHDRIGQSLALAQIKLTSVRDGLTGSPRAAVDAAVELLEQSDADTRSLTFELSPPVLYDLGLADALNWLAEEMEKRHGMHIEVIDDAANKPLDETSRALVFRAIRELVMNVTKHAQTPAAKVTLRRIDHQFEIAVEDSGAGFDAAAEAKAKSGSGGFGLLSVREQIRRLGGTMVVESAPKHGTRVCVRVPLDTSPKSEET